jgi:hypothetical protein
MAMAGIGVQSRITLYAALAGLDGIRRGVNTTCQARLGEPLLLHQMKIKALFAWSIR